MRADEHVDQQVTASTSLPVNVMADATLATTAVPVPPAVPVLDGFVPGAAGAPSDVIKRIYPVHTFTWTSALAQGYYERVSFPDALFAQPFIKDKLKNYTYFKAGVALSVRLNGNKFNYGALILSWDPATTMDIQATGFADSNIFTSSGFPHLLINANDAETPELTVPFVFPQTALVPRVQGGGQIGTFDITVLCPLTTISSVVAPKVEVTVYAHFTDIIIDGPTEATDVLSEATALKL